MKLLFAALPLLTLLGAASVSPSPQSPSGWVPGEPNKKTSDSGPPLLGLGEPRSPVELALSRDGRLAVTANRTGGTLSVVDLDAGKVLREISVGGEPFGVALTPDGKSAVVSLLADDALAVVPLDGVGAVIKILVGDEPRGIALSEGGKTAYVALGGADSVAQVDLETRKVIRKISVEKEPWQVALSADGKTLVVGNTRGRSASVIDTPTGKARYTVTLSGRNVRHLAISPDGKWAYVPFIAERLASATVQNIDRGWVVGNRLGRVPLTEDGPREAITLDTAGDATADLDGLALSPDGKTLALTAAGTHELLLLAQPEMLPFVAYGGPGDHSETPTRRAMKRVPLGGAPRSARFSPDGKSVVVANYFSDTVQTVDVASGKLVRTVALGESVAPSLVREGEVLFHDATKSFGGWYSCASCHVEGHTGGGSFDTLNDGGYGKPKKTPSLRGVALTAPYTWHGWQKSLRLAVHDSFVNSMQGPEPSEHDMLAVEAYLKSLSFRSSPFPKTAQTMRGAQIFRAKSCDSCHSGQNFTGSMVNIIGLEEMDDEYKGFNPPTLKNCYARAPYLHDGRAETLEDVLKTYHRPSKLTGKPDCSPTELSDLVAYLKTL